MSNETGTGNSENKIANRRPDRLLDFALWPDCQVRELRPIFETIIRQRTEIVRHSHQQSFNDVGDSTWLADEFASIFQQALEPGHAELTGGCFDGQGVDSKLLGELLATHRLPLDEVVALLQLFGDRLRNICLQERSTPDQLISAFDRSGRVIAMLLVWAACRYHRSIGGRRGAAPRLDHDRAGVREKTATYGPSAATFSIRELYKRVEAAAATEEDLLLVGEKGSGVELVARAIHNLSARAERTFVALNCAALPQDLIECELFGYARDAFNGASAEHMGLFWTAHGGTLLIEGMTALTASTQATLLETVKEQAIRPIGSQRWFPVNVRLIVSINEDPKAALSTGKLSPELYDRLETAVVVIPEAGDGARVPCATHQTVR
jgi:hypothetical protein